ncbi:MAG: FHA domain-containing protein [Elainella sp.]
MIVCPNCNHQNPDAAIQCEACYTPLPEMTTCPSCGTSVQADASFCGQCGFNLREAAQTQPAARSEISAETSPETSSETSEASITAGTLTSEPGGSSLPAPDPAFEIPALSPLEPLVTPASLSELTGTPSEAEPTTPEAESKLSPVFGSTAEPAPSPEPAVVSSSSVAPAVASSSSPMSSATGSQTQLQTQTARLLHVQTNTTVELPGNLAVIHIGKPNDRIPPDVDVSGFPHSEIVSRIHADIRVEGDIFYIEDVGSSNGTYINNAPLPSGNRHRLRPGDRIALGKGDKVTFLFQIS